MSVDPEEQIINIISERSTKISNINISCPIINATFDIHEISVINFNTNYKAENERLASYNTNSIAASLIDAGFSCGIMTLEAATYDNFYTFVKKIYSHHCALPWIKTHVRYM